MMPNVRFCLVAVIAASVMLCDLSSLRAQQPPLADDSFQLSTQGKVPLSDFIDYVANRLKIKILYDESLRQRNINLVAPDPVPVSAIPELLQSVLLNEGLVVTDTDQLGFKTITTSDKMLRVSRPSGSSEDLAGVDPALALTRVFVLAESRPGAIAESLKPFLTIQGSSVIPLDRSGILIVSDVAANIRRVEQLIEILDAGQVRVEIEFVPVKNVSVETLAEQLTAILDAKQRALGYAEDEDLGLEVTSNPRSNQLILIGTKSEISQARVLLEKLDGDLGTEVGTYSLEYNSPNRLDEVVRGLLENRALSPPYESRVEGNSLIVESTAEVLQLVERTRAEIDTREAPNAQSPIRFYKIKNVPAQELAETIRGIGVNVTTSGNRRSVNPRQRTTNDAVVPGPNRNPLIDPGVAQAVREPVLPPAVRQTEPTPAPVQPQEPTDELNRVGGFNLGFPEQLADQTPQANSPLGAESTVTVDIHTNTIIVVAPPETQRLYAQLIETLDQRRPQVLLEAKVVIIDTSDDYTLGVEVSGGDRTGGRRLFSFSSYGLSTVDPTSGALSIVPGVGFNGALVDPTTADAVVRALATHRRARVLSTPRILVNDNAEGQLTSVLEVPFTSINASQTVATTSFAGFAEAGTTITATPTIAEDNYLQVDYIVTLNSFTGTGADGVPPPRQTNEIQSRVTVPDGYTIIVGGLTSRNNSYETDSIPWLESIPVIRDLVSLQTKNWQQTSLFVFLKPIILREDKFKDLRFLSDVQLRTSESQTNFPVNEPLLIE
ncbi:MAG: secretin N-terminal domain-containing protein [Planctomycetota bacterium]